ncbi:DUF222 domain-containing protein [Rhodococcus sp. Eu-32]|uniref:DUF222 domain-containing protein n=1 Tax=Rhodococcus sp. Eu-32 TaxID=1017319 RepID=UPI001FB3F450|nr:DUF222 domain-containing protein [Rhodococcus sp. Eu-32]
MLVDADRRSLLVRMEKLSRAMYGTSHTWLTELIESDGLAVLPDRTNPSRLASLLLIDPSVAGKRIKIAAKIADGRALTGERLEPQYPSTAEAHRGGDIDAAHVTVIDEFFKDLPAAVDHDSKVQSEILLSDLAKQVTPEQLRVAAARLHALLDPDGELTDEKDVVAKCFFRLGRQGKDGLSKGSFVIDAEFRAYLEAILAKYAKAGNCNPDEPTPVLDEDGAGGDGDGADSAADSGADSEPTLFDRDEDPGSPSGEAPDSPSGEAPDSPSDESGPAGSDSPSGSESLSDSDVSAGSDSSGGSASSVDDSGLAGGLGSDSDCDPAGDSGPADEPGSADGADSARDSGTARDSVNSEDEKRRAGRDTRNQGQRNHDAVKAVLRQMLASGNLGRHRGLPVTAVITMTAKDLETASGHAVTGTGSLVTMRDAIRMASHAHHYLAIFDNDGRALYLGRSKRLASADQRIVLMARDRGCTFPMCTRPATWCQVHHLNEWATGGETDIDSLTFGCDLHHPLVGDGPNDWATTTTGPDHPQPGRTQWHPPASVDPDRRGLVNHYHHPLEYLYTESEDPEP